MIKNTVKINFDNNVPRLKPLKTFRAKSTDSTKGYNWEKFRLKIS